MDTQKVTNPNPQVNAGAGAPDVTKLSPAEAVVQLRVFGSQVPDIAPLTKEERKALRTFARIPRPVVRASVRVIGASDAVQQAVGQPEANVRQWIDDEEGWNEVEDELRALLKSVADANLVRRQRVGLAATRAYIIGQQVARDPNNAALRPHLDEVKRQKALTRRKKPAQQPETPEPAPEPTPRVTTQE